MDKYIYMLRHLTIVVSAKTDSYPGYKPLDFCDLDFKELFISCVMMNPEPCRSVIGLVI